MIIYPSFYAIKGNFLSFFHTKINKSMLSIEFKVNGTRNVNYCKFIDTRV